MDFIIIKKKLSINFENIVFIEINAKVNALFTFVSIRRFCTDKCEYLFISYFSFLQTNIINLWILGYPNYSIFSSLIGG